MTITAKFPGKCTVCGGAIRPGQQIEWRKGAGSHHASCGAADPAPAAKPPRARKSPASRARRTAPPAGPEMRNDRAPYTMGEVLTCQLSAREISECEARQSIAATDVPGDKPIKRAGDRRVAVVVIHTDRMRQDDADDNGYCGRYGAIVRLATAEESAPLLAERAAKTQAQADAAGAAQAWAAELAALTAGRILVEGGAIDRVGAEVLHEERKGLHGTVSARWSRLADGSIAQETYAYDDERWGRWVTTEQLLDLARASTRTLEEAIRGQRYSALDRAIVWLAAQAGETPRPPVTVTLRGLSVPVTLEVRWSSWSPGLVVAAVQDPSFQRKVDDQWITEYTWPIDRLRTLLDAPAPAEAFADLEFAPGAEIGGDRLALQHGLWIEGMRGALAHLEGS